MKKILVTGGLAVAIILGTAGSVAADPGGDPNDNSGNHTNYFSKAWMCDGELVGNGAGAGLHWRSDFNPSDVNAYKPDPSCKLVYVYAGAYPGTGP